MAFLNHLNNSFKQFLLYNTPFLHQDLETYRNKLENKLPKLFLSNCNYVNYFTVHFHSPGTFFLFDILNWAKLLYSHTMQLLALENSKLSA